MAVDYSVETIKYLEKLFSRQKVHRPLRRQRYDPGSELILEITGVLPATPAEVKLRVEKLGLSGKNIKYKSRKGTTLRP